NIQLPQDGEYTLVVGSFNNSGGADHTYRLTLELGAIVTVTVFEAPGVPVAADDPNLQVSLLDAAGNRVGIVSGRNPATLPASSGDYQLQTRLDFAERSVPLMLADGQQLMTTVEYDFGRVVLQVLEAAGIPAQDAQVVFHSDTYRTSSFGSQQEVRLPAGSYTIEASVENVTSTLENVLVEPGTVQELTIDLRLGRLDIELPAAQGIVLASGDSAMEVQLVQDGQVLSSRTSDTSDPQPMTLVARAGPAVVRYISGVLIWDVPVTVVAGQTITVPFDAPALAAQYGLSLFTATIYDQADQVATQGTQLALIDSPGQTLLALAQDPPPGTTYLAPAGVLIRSRLRDQEQLRRNLPVGVPTELLITFAPVVEASTSPASVQVDIAIEAPQNGEIVCGDLVTVTGRASTTGPAGATRIAIVLDVSGSAEDFSGADLDGDGVQETIIQAEAAAGQLLLDELERIEAQSPGTAFAVTVLRFASVGEVIAPLMRMSNPRGVATLRAGLERIAQEGAQGGTNYVAALDTAVTALRAVEEPGNTFILFMTDGAPNELKPSLDAAVRAGLASVVIHTFGLGSTFLGEISPHVFFPPDPSTGPDILATVAALGAPGGTITALPNPADIVQIIPRLPILELPEAELQAVQVTNVTTGQPALTVEVSRDGGFQAQVPVSLIPQGTLDTNTLSATAIAADGVSSATTQVQVRGIVPPELTVTLSTIDQNRGALDVGDVLTFVLTLTNAGSGPATGLDITVPLPEGVVVLPGTLRADQPATLSEETGQLRIQLDNLPSPGAGRSSLVITFQGVVQSDTALQATVTSQELGAQVSDDPFTATSGDATVVHATP
ncbi:MAG: VWA domain-containing protein, partial [Deinococcus sp.]|nr:VWA domain-containing protein [Deinococcus sp.]